MITGGTPRCIRQGLDHPKQHPAQLLQVLREHPKHLVVGDGREAGRVADEPGPDRIKESVS